MGKKKVKQYEFLAFRKLSAVVFLLSFIAVLISGLSAGADVFSIVYRGGLVALVLMVVQRVVLQILSTAKEMDRGQG